jgi:hypothetical protein
MRIAIFVFLLLTQMALAVPTEDLLRLDPKRPETEQRPQFQVAAAKLAMAQDIVTIERVCNQLGQSGLRFADGNSALVRFYGMLEDYPQTVELWRKKYPKSIHPVICSVDIHCTRAWESRGGGYANTVTAKGWKGFEGELRLAEQDCRTAEKLDPKSAALYEAWLTVAMGSNYSTERTRALFLKGQKCDPLFLEIYRAYAPTAMNRWGGSLKDRQAFVSDASRVLDPKLGEGAGYALVCISLADYADGGPDQAEEELGRLDRDRLRTGLAALANKYSSSRHYANWLYRFLVYDPTPKDRIFARRKLVIYKNRLDLELQRKVKD